MVLYGTRTLEERGQVYTLLARAAREHWGLESLPQMLRQPEGKPWFPGHPGLAFNVSHSGSLGLCALSGRPVGVDIQIVKQWRPGLPGRVCSPKELAWLEQQPDRWRAFAVLWTLKESRVKQSGRGLREPIREIRVPLPGEMASSFDGLWFGCYQENNWVAAVCGEEPPPAEIGWYTMRDGGKFS